MNTYTELKEQHSAEVNSFPMMFAFSQKQFDEGMIKLGLAPTDTDQVCSIGGGGMVKKTDKKALQDMFTKHEAETQTAIENDPTGEGFIFEMFNYELGNHEYCYTRDTEQTLEALGFTQEDINSNEKLSHGLQMACNYQTDNDDYY